MKKCILFFSLIFTVFEVFAQCTNPNAWLTVNAPTINTPLQIGTCTFQDEYNTINNIVSGRTYTITSSCGGYITVRRNNASGPVVASGNSPLTYTATNNGTHYVHYNTNAACGTASNCCTTTITCTSCSAPVGCLNTTSYGSANAATNNSPVTISTCNFQSEYATVGSIISGNTYSFGSSCGGYITVRQGTFDGPTVANGNAPLSWTATSSGTFYIHYNTNSSCGTASNCCVTSVTCTSCPAPPPPPTCSGNPAAGDDCANATPICDLNGYCGNTSSSYNINSWPQLETAFCGSLDNNSFVSFVASATTVQLDVYVSNCLFGDGIQLLVFSAANCSGPVVDYYCWNPANEMDETLIIPGLTVGSTYYVMIDGYAGDVCDYVIGANSGVQLPVIASNDTAICIGQSASLSATGGNGSYTWTPSTNLSCTNCANPVANPLVTTSYIVTSATGNPLCPSSTVDTVTVTVNTGSPLQLSGSSAISGSVGPAQNINLSICNGSSANLSVSGGTIYTWSPTTNLSCSPCSNPTANPSSTRTYTVTSNNAVGCPSTGSATITVNPIVIPLFPELGPYCSGSTIPALPTTSDNGITGTWSPALSNTISRTYTFTPNANQCATTQTLSITIINPPQFGATPPNATVCENIGVSFGIFGVIGDNLIYQWQHDTGSGYQNIYNNATYSGTNTATINISNTPASFDLTNFRVFVYNDCDTLFSNAILLIVNQRAVVIQQAQDTTICIPNNAFFTFSANNVNAYQWQVNTGSTWANISNNAIYSGVATDSLFLLNPPLSYSGYRYRVRYTDECGITLSSTPATLTITTIITPNFAAVGPYCAGATIPALPTNSTNGISGSWSPAINNTTTTLYTFTPTAGQCATTQTLTITINPIITPSFAAVGPFCAGATIPALPTNSTNGISGSWSPAINNTTTTLYTFTPTAGQCATTQTLTITINPNITPSFAAVGPYCAGATIPALPTNSTNGISGSWSPAINNTTTTLYTFTPTAGQCATTQTLTITINPNITPSFAAVGPYCAGATIPALPTNSTNGISGSWSPAINNTTTTLYTFTPTAGQCATTQTLTITINPNITPSFAAVGPYCAGATIPALPTNSTNGISGSWSPAINNTTTTLYTFTPTAGQCATTQTLTITINPNITPSFAAVGPYCAGATIPALPTNSTNGISGSWSPAINNTTTTLYTFTPTAGQCATTQTLTITINPNITPSFAAVGPYCAGATIPALPTNSTNGISGSWSPAINNTTTTLYTFTPTAGQCATTQTLTITINPNITPSFAAVGPYCAGATIPALPTNSTNGISGSWSPAINNTTTTLYTFTPTAGQCATTQTLTITINPNITPSFAAVGPYCAGATIPALPTNSTNGISGSWSPAINNTTTTLYTFTPTAGQCATTQTLTITINPNITPSFAAVGPYCAGATIPALPTNSTNGISGSWSPAINNTTTTLYTFTPTAGQCATTQTSTITINPILNSTFDTTICFGASFNLNGTIYNASNLSGTEIFTASTGCDSIVTVTVVERGIDSTFATSTSCNPIDTGVFISNLVNTFGCDSVHTQSVTLLPSDSTFVTSYSCNVNDVGTEIVVFNNQFGCDSFVITETFQIEINYNVLDEFVQINANEVFTFDVAGVDNNFNMSWYSSNGASCPAPCSSFELTPSAYQEIYYFTLVDTLTGCEVLDTLIVEILYNSSLDIPNIFTPNGDGQNDIYRAYGKDIVQYQLEIFDRWGGRVFNTNILEEGWDGIFNSKPVESGIYIIVVNAAGLDGQRYEIKQNIKLVR